MRVVLVVVLLVGLFPMLVGQAASPSLDSAPWYLDALGVHGMREEGLDGAGVVIAVLDSGIQKQHPELAGRFWTNPDEVPGNGLDDDLNGFVDDADGWDMCHDAPPRADPPFGHGTFVAGILGSDPERGRGVQGIAPGVALMDVEVFCDDDTFPDRAGLVTADALRAGVRYAVDEGADIISMSLQLWPDDGPSTLEGLLGVRDAFEYAHDAGVLLVASAGNLGKTGPSSPGDMPHVLTVGAMTGCGSRFGFSNHGPGIDLWAPGEALSLVGDGVEWWRGTSFAAPMVSGAAALLLQQDPARTAADVERLLLDAAWSSIEGPALDLHAFTDAASPPVPGPVHYLGPATVPGVHYLQFEGSDAPLLEVTVDGVGQWCFRLADIGDQWFVVRLGPLGGDADVMARLWNGLEPGPAEPVHLVLDASLADHEPVPMWVKDASHARATPMPWSTPLLAVLAVLAVLRRGKSGPGPTTDGAPACPD